MVQGHGAGPLQARRHVHAEGIRRGRPLRDPDDVLRHRVADHQPLPAAVRRADGIRDGRLGRRPLRALRATGPSRHSSSSPP